MTDPDTKRPERPERPAPGAEGRRETELERLDRNYNELLQELRVAQTGVQILFAFLLSLPFLQRFDIDELDRKLVYSTTILAAAVAAGLLIAPVAYHRVVFRLNRKQEVVRVANRLALAGLAFLLLSICGSLFLVFDQLWSAEAATVVAVVFAVLSVLLWYVLPARRLRQDPEPPRDDAAAR